MIQLPGHLVVRYQAYCRGCGINDSDRANYLKWLSFFLDYSEKYQITGEVETRILKFLNKLQEKKQGEDRLRQAHHAITLCFKMLKNNPGNQPMVLGGSIQGRFRPKNADCSRSCTRTRHGRVEN